MHTNVSKHTIVVVVVIIAVIAVVRIHWMVPSTLIVLTGCCEKKDDAFSLFSSIFFSWALFLEQGKTASDTSMIGSTHMFIVPQLYDCCQRGTIHPDRDSGSRIGNAVLCV